MKALSNLVKTCLICNHPLLRRVHKSQITWFCRRCREEFTDSTISLHKNSSLRCFPRFNAETEQRSCLLEDEKTKSIYAQTSVKSCLTRSHFSQTDMLTCVYDNQTNHPQVLCILNIPLFHLEKTVMPGQRLIFEAPETAQISIMSGDFCSMIHADTIACEKLAI